VANKSSEPRDDEYPSLAASKSTMQDRIAAFRMLDGMREATLAQKVVRLSVVGFPTAEIAAMLQTTPATVYQYVYESRKRALKKPKARAIAT
jgi:DNA-directed RNA polymerase specialized sigma24 family protein